MSADAGTRNVARLVTLAFVCCGDRVLLARHPDNGDRFPGLWNGIGGHVESGEDIRGAARRELFEETGLDVPDLHLRGVVHEKGLLGVAHVVFVFLGEAGERVLHSPEGKELVWQPIDRVAQLPLVHDVAALLQRARSASEPFFATEIYDGADGCTSLRLDGADAVHV